MATSLHTSASEYVEVSFLLPVSGLSDQLKSEAISKAKEAYVMTLLSAGEITSGKAAHLLDMSRLEIIERMGQQKISLFDDSMDLESLHQEVDQASMAIDSAHSS